MLCSWGGGGGKTYGGGGGGQNVRGWGHKRKRSNCCYHIIQRAGEKHHAKYQLGSVARVEVFTQKQRKECKECKNKKKHPYFSA